MKIRGVWYEHTASPPEQPGLCWAYFRKPNKVGEPIPEYTVCQKPARPDKLTCEHHPQWERVAQARKFSDEHFNLELFLILHKGRRRYEKMIRTGHIPRGFAGDPQALLDHTRKQIEAERLKPEIPTAAVRQREAEALRKR